MAGSRGLKEKVSAALMGTLACLLVLEFSLRILGILAEHRNSGAPGASDRVAGLRTILCVGDSFTWGAGAPPDMSWPRQLERLLNGDGKLPSAVVNRGMAGQNSTRLVENFQYNLDSVRPDLVILCTGTANLWDAYGSSLGQDRHGWGPTVIDCLYRIRVFRLARLLYLNVCDARRKSEAAAARASLEASRKAWQDKVEASVSVQARTRSRECSLQGTRHFMERRLSEAAQCFREGMGSDPFNAENFIGMARWSEALHASPEAEEWLRKGIQADPYDTRSHAALADFLMANSRSEEAVEWLQKAREINPKEPDVLAALARLHVGRQQFAEALECLQQALQATQGGRREIHVQISQVYQAMNEYDKAAAELKAVLEKNPDDCACQAALGEILARAGEYRQAARYFEEAVRSRPAQVEYLMGLAHCHLELDELPQAVKYFRRAALLSPRDAAERLGDACRLAGRDAEAQAWYQKAMELHPENAAQIHLKRLVPAGQAHKPSRTPPRQLLSAPGTAPLIDAWLRSDLSRVIAMCRKAGVPVLLHGYPSGALGEVLAGVARENKVVFVDHHPVFMSLEAPETYYAPDLHCNALGYGVMAKDLYPRVMEILATPQP